MGNAASSARTRRAPARTTYGSAAAVCTQHLAASEAQVYDPIVLAAAKSAARLRKMDDFDPGNEFFTWIPNDGAALEASLEINPDFAAAPIRLIDARFLISLWKSGGRLPRRQDIPEAAYISLTKLKAMPKGYMKTDLRILCVSHMWLRPDHPDPRGDSLRALGKVLDKFVRDRFDGGTWAVFIDFCSLPQLGARGEARSPSEMALLQAGLHALASLFSHPCTWTLKLTQLPADFPAAFDFPAGSAPNVAQYEERGWCWTEAAVSNLVKPYTQVLDVSRFSDAPGMLLPDVIRECRAGRQPPLTPESFGSLLHFKSFTWRDADLPTVRELYTTSFDERFAKAETLDYLDLGWRDEEVEELCRVAAAGALRRTRTLNLIGNHVSDAGMAALAASLGTDGVAPALEIVELFGNSASEAACARVLTSLREAQERERRAVRVES